MGGLIPESFIEELLGRVDIVELIERHVPLKRAGKEFQACCPYQDEKNTFVYSQPAKAVLSLFWLWRTRLCHRVHDEFRGAGIC